MAQSPQALTQGRLLGHGNICLRCGRSLAARVSHALHKNTIRESRIYNVIQEWIIPCNIEATSHICHKCWMAADRASVQMTWGPSTSLGQDSPQIVEPHEEDLPDVSPNAGVSSNQAVPSIVLSEYMRAIETERRCFIEGCRGTERYRVPLTTRKMLFNEYKYYIPQNNRLCAQHLVIEAWDLLDSLTSNYVQTFTERHIYDMMSLRVNK
ncbi:unnamed protein product [Danaus chrysippus]|uniref:(African queen) hypothetical protein n=1 Tax=Danaus chrysippus TaxID=151541 RepID=A0A8J2RC54_9NEOP|nr:unnamed protein product [Danaus chrysippus]